MNKRQKRRMKRQQEKLARRKNWQKKQNYLRKTLGLSPEAISKMSETNLRQGNGLIWADLREVEV
jgi:hypothetical protein